MRTVRWGMTLLELTITMGLMSIIMLPLIGLMSTTSRVYSSTIEASSGDYVRSAALDAARQFLTGAVSVDSASRNDLRVRMSGSIGGRLYVSGNTLYWQRTGGSPADPLQTVAIGVKHFDVAEQRIPGAPASAGSTITLTFVTQQSNEPVEASSTTSIWIRPEV